VIAVEIATALGGARHSRGWWRCRCPAHGSRGPTLALRDGERGLIVKCFAGCDAHDLLAELRRRGLIGCERDHDRPTRATIRGGDPADDTARRIALARRIWEGAWDARGSPVMAYFTRRCITIPVPPVLRWAPALRRPDGSNGPALVARVDDVDGELIGVHRTWLDRDPAGQWHRRDRASFGPIAGGAVRLAPTADTLLIGEGLETCLSGMQASELPAWAALSAGGIEGLILPPPPLAATVVILADNDANGRGERAARTAAQRWLAEGRRVQIAMPPEPGTDFNDVLLGRAYREARDVAA
jgi:putative DNA primase/helicase